MQITIEQARGFLNEITSENKVAIIHHDDTDGFVSGVLLYDFCRKKGANVGHFCFSNGGDQDKMIKKIKNSDVVLIADFGPSSVSKILEFAKDKKVLYIDHHKKDVEIPPEINEYRTKSEVSASKSVWQIAGGKVWLEIVCELADAGYTNVENKIKIDAFARERKISPDEVKEKFYFRIDYFLAYFFENYDEAFEILDSVGNYNGLDNLDKYANVVKKEIDKFVNELECEKKKLGDVWYYYFEPYYPIKSIVTTDISFKYPDDVFVFAMPFGNVIGISARCQSGKVDCAEFLKKAVKEFEGANAGGHFKAAGGQVLKKDLEKFKERLREI